MVQPATVKTVQLGKGTGAGATRTYVASVLDKAGQPILGADLDIGGLGADPDLRVPTVPMVAVPGDSTYTATVDFPADSDWVMVVRVHAPSQAVELFSEKITGTGTVTSYHDAATASPSRRTMAKYDPTLLSVHSPAAGTPSTDAHSFGSSFAFDHRFDFSQAVFALVHSAGAFAWIISVLGLVLANRLGPGSARNEVSRFIAHHYRMLAGGGLLLVFLTGIQVALHGSAGLNHPTELLRSRIGTAYLAVFALKMTLVIGSLVTSWRLGRALPVRRQFALQHRLASVGAMANDDTSAHGSSSLYFRLAETNAVLGALILSCVIILGQLHHALH